MPEHNEFRPKPMGKRYAACEYEVTAALRHMMGVPMIVRRVAENETDKKCYCGRFAEYYFMEVEPSNATKEA